MLDVNKEMDKLEKYLKKGFYYERFPFADGEVIVVKTKHNIPLWQASYYSDSLGIEEGLLEVRGKALLGNNEIDCMAASDIIEYME